MKHFVYILTNELYNDKEGKSFVKIGITENIPRRIKELSSTGVPVPFELFFAIEVESREIAKEIENRILEGMSFVRNNSKREFLRIEPEDLKSILQIAEIMGARAVTKNDLEKNPTSIKENNTKSYSSVELDVIICPSDKKGGFDEVFMNKGQWWGGYSGLKIAKSRIENLKYIAIYRGLPFQNITHFGKIKKIIPDDRDGKSEYSKIILEGKPIELPNGPINYDSNAYPPQDRVYVESEKLFNAKVLSDVLIRRS